MKAKGGRVYGEVPAMLTREIVDGIRFKTLQLLTEHNYFYKEDMGGAMQTAAAKFRELSEEELEQLAKEVTEDLKGIMT